MRTFRKANSNIILYQFFSNGVIYYDNKRDKNIFLFTSQQSKKSWDFHSTFCWLTIFCAITETEQKFRILNFTFVLMHELNNFDISMAHCRSIKVRSRVCAGADNISNPYEARSVPKNHYGFRLRFIRKCYSYLHSSYSYIKSLYYLGSKFTWFWLYCYW